MCFIFVYFLNILWLYHFGYYFISLAGTGKIFIQSTPDRLSRKFDL